MVCSRLDTPRACCSHEGKQLGDKKSLESLINIRTGIPVQALRGLPLSNFSVEERRAWAAKRKTTRKEDMAYCLLGTFGVYISTIYGEGDHAFVRLDDAINKLQRQRDGELSTEEYNCLQLLCPSGIDYESQKNQNPVRVPNTCLWTLQNPKYLECRDNDTKRLVWISADPGCGKSVLARCIIDEDLPSAFQNHTSKQILYHFFKDTSIEQRSASQAICTVLHQLFMSCPRLIRYAIPEHKKWGPALFTNFSKLWSVFIAAATDPTAGDVICVFDALDECNEQERSILIENLEDFCLRLRTSSFASRLKLLITSRPYFNIRQRLDKILEESDNIELAGNEESASIKKEIDLVIKDRVANLGKEIRLDPKVSHHLEKRLLETEHRTYLWLYLLWNIIRKNLLGTKSDMDKLIDKLPDDIQGSYEELLQKCPDPVFARKVLQIVLVAARPLTLAEIDVALNVNEKTSSYAELELEGSSRLQEMLPSRCGLMVSIVQSKVYFIHQTVKEFLLCKIGVERPDGRVWQQSLGLEKSHHLLAKICLQSISFSEVELCHTNIWNALLPDHSRDTKSNTYSQSYVFLSYSTRYWADHFRDQKSNKGIEFIETFLKSSCYDSILDGRGDNWGGVLQVASYIGQDFLVQMLLNKGVDVNAQGGIFGNALLAASEYGGKTVVGQKTVVEMLLGKGADVNAQGGVYGNALQVASIEGNEIVVQMLLDAGADVNAQVGVYGNALRAASMIGDEIVVQMLLDGGADVNTRDIDLGNALQVASRDGHEKVVQILLDNGADVNAGDEYGNALTMASEKGYETVVQTLLENGADVNAQSMCGSALLLASSKGYEIVVQMLLDKGADINAQGDLYGNALQAASRKGYKIVVQMLLDNGADVNAQSGYWDMLETLPTAEAIRILLAPDTVIDARNYSVGTALHAASEGGHETVVQMLLDNGADVNVPGSRYGRALQAALENGHRRVVQMLLVSGAPRQRKRKTISE